MSCRGWGGNARVPEMQQLLIRARKQDVMEYLEQAQAVIGECRKIYGELLSEGLLTMISCKMEGNC